MSNKNQFDVKSIERVSEITRDVIKNISAKDAIYLREKFGSELNAHEILEELVETFQSGSKDRLSQIEQAKKNK